MQRSRDDYQHRRLENKILGQKFVLYCAMMLFGLKLFHTHTQVFPEQPLTLAGFILLCDYWMLKSDRMGIISIVSASAVMSIIVNAISAFIGPAIANFQRAIEMSFLVEFVTILFMATPA